MEDVPPPLLSLPLEILDKICSYLSSRHDVAALWGTCRVFRELPLPRQQVQITRPLTPDLVSTADDQMHTYTYRVKVPARPNTKTEVMQFCERMKVKGFVRLVSVNYDEGSPSKCTHTLDVVVQGYSKLRVIDSYLRNIGTIIEENMIAYGPRYKSFKMHKNASSSSCVMTTTNNNPKDESKKEEEKVSGGSWEEPRYIPAELQAFPFSLPDEVSSHSSTLSDLCRKFEKVEIYLQKREEDEARRRDEEARRRDEEARRRDEEARRYEQTLTLLLQRQEEEARRRDEEARRYEQNLTLLLQRQQEETRRREEEVARREEEARRREEEARRQQEEARRHEEEARRQQELTAQLINILALALGSRSGGEAPSAVGSNLPGLLVPPNLTTTTTTTPIVAVNTLAPTAPADSSASVTHKEEEKEQVKQGQ